MKRTLAHSSITHETYAKVFGSQILFRKGDAGPVSVASSQFATVAVVLSVLFNRERMRWWQGIGVGSTAMAVALIAAGS